MQSHNIKLCCAVTGTGFWANYQIVAWLEIPWLKIVALHNRTKKKVEAINEKFVFNGMMQINLKVYLKDSVTLASGRWGHRPRSSLCRCPHRPKSGAII